jgi:hypothetical protein
MDADLHAELHRANQRARHPRLDITALRASPKLATAWGVAPVEFFGRFYQPAEDRHWALIVAVVEDGDLVDLCAVDLESRRTGTRLGFGRVLGFDALGRARREGHTIYLREHVLDWLRKPDAAACVLDWAQAPHLLNADLGDWRLRCASRNLSQRVRRALAQPVSLPRLEVPQ